MQKIQILTVISEEIRNSQLAILLFIEFKFNLIYNFQFGSFNNYIQFQAVFFAYGFIIIILCSLVITFLVFIQAQE